MYQDMYQSINIQYKTVSWDQGYASIQTGGFKYVIFSDGKNLILQRIGCFDIVLTFLQAIVINHTKLN